jgi:dUTP diphosphatase
MNTVKFKKLFPDAVMPSYAHEGDAGADLYSIDSVAILPGAFALVGTGIAVAMPINWVGLIHPRSGLAAKFGVSIVNTPGTVDSGYRGEIKINLINHGTSAFRVAKGDRIAQIVFQTFERADFVEVADLDTTIRGVNGYGSTGGFNG